MRVWDLDRGAGPVTLDHRGAGILRCVCFAPDNALLFTASWNEPADGSHSKNGTGTLRAWDPATGKPVREVAIPRIVPDVVSLSPDGAQAAVGGYSDRPLRLLDLRRGVERSLWDGPGDNVLAVAFSPDGRVLAAGGDDRQARLFETATGKEVLRLARHERWVSAVAFAPGGRALATADGGWLGRPQPGEGPLTVRFWDVATGRELARLGGHASNVTSLAFSPDGRRLVGGLHNGTALVWETPAGANPAAPAGRRLSAAEVAALGADLAGDDARKAYAAVRALAGSPDQAVALLAGTLRPAARPDAGQVRKWIADLDADAFATREAASRQLARLGEDAEAELRAALASAPPPEVRRRVESLLTAALDAPPAGRRREVRGVWVLELAGTPAARGVLAGLAGGDPAARLTREAKAALDRH